MSNRKMVDRVEFHSDNPVFAIVYMTVAHHDHTKMILLGRDPILAM